MAQFPARCPRGLWEQGHGRVCTGQVSHLPGAERCLWEGLSAGDEAGTHLSWHLPCPPCSCHHHRMAQVENGSDHQIQAPSQHCLSWQLRMGSPAPCPPVGKALPLPCPALLYWQGVTFLKCSPEMCRISYTFHHDSCDCVSAFQTQTAHPSLRVPTGQSPPPDCLSSLCLLDSASTQHSPAGGCGATAGACGSGRARLVSPPRGKGHGSPRGESPSGQWGSCCPHTPMGCRLQEYTSSGCSELHLTQQGSQRGLSPITRAGCPGPSGQPGSAAYNSFVMFAVLC